LSIREPNKLLWEYDLLANKLIDPSGSAGAMANPSTMFVDKDGCPLGWCLRTERRFAWGNSAS
jgi:hypothetical protein